MTINASEIDFNLHGVERYGSQLRGFYPLYLSTATKNIEVNGVIFVAVYQTGVSYDYEDYNYPSNTLELSGEGGTSEELMMIDAVLEDELLEEQAAEAFNDVKDALKLNSIEEFREIWSLLRDKPNLASHLDDSHNFDIDAYNEDEHTRELTLKD